MGVGATATRQVVVQVETLNYFIRLKFISETNQGSCMTNRNPNPNKHDIRAVGEGGG